MKSAHDDGTMICQGKPAESEFAGWCRDSAPCPCITYAASSSTPCPPLATSCLVNAQHF